MWLPGLGPLLIIRSGQHGLLLQAVPEPVEELNDQLCLFVHQVGGRELGQQLLQLVFPPLKEEPNETVSVQQYILAF